MINVPRVVRDDRRSTYVRNCVYIPGPLWTSLISWKVDIVPHHRPLQLITIFNAHAILVMCKSKQKNVLLNFRVHRGRFKITRSKFR